MLLFKDENVLAKIETILSASGAGLWEIRVNTINNTAEMFADAQMAMLLGVDNESMSAGQLFEWWFSRVDDAYKEDINTTMIRVLTTDDKDFDLEYPWHSKTKRTYVRCSGRLISMVDGMGVIVGYHQDISDHYHARVKQEKQLRNFELASEIGDYAVFELEYSNMEQDNELSVFANSLFSSMFGKLKRVTNAEEWCRMRKFFPEDQGDLWCSLVEHNSWQVNGKIEHELFATLTDGSQKWLMLTYQVMKNIDSRLRLIGFIKDISAMKEREEQLAEANTTKSLFLANMSHEIRTPMNAVINFAKFMLDTELDETQKTYMDRIVSSSLHMLNIMNDILDFSKIEANKMTIENAPFITLVEFNNVKDMLEKSVEEKQLNFTVNWDERIPMVLIGDSIRIRQVLLNLLSNAIKFTHKGGSITLSADFVEQIDNAAWIKIVISDTGIGMSEEQLSRIFSAFTQADVSITRRFGGTGLGLVISKMLVTLVGGNISVESKPNEGTTFTINVPFDLPTSEQILCINEEINKTVEENIKFVGLSCLVAEDNIINQEVVRALFKTLLIDLEIADNGEEALNMFKANEQKYDCIFMDVQMPVMDGYTATQNIRALDNKRAKEIPIFALTANAVRGEGDKSMQVGMNEHLTKPLSKMEIIQTLAKYFPEKILSKDFVLS